MLQFRHHQQTLIRKETFARYVWAQHRQWTQHYPVPFIENLIQAVMQMRALVHHRLPDQYRLVKIFIFNFMAYFILRVQTLELAINSQSNILDLRNMLYIPVSISFYTYCA